MQSSCSRPLSKPAPRIWPTTWRSRSRLPCPALPRRGGGAARARPAASGARRPGGALTLIEAAHRLAPEGRTAHNLAMVLTRLGRTEDALARVREAIAEYPDYMPAWFGLASLLAEPARAARPPRCWLHSPIARCVPATSALVRAGDRSRGGAGCRPPLAAVAGEPAAHGGSGRRCAAACWRFGCVLRPMTSAPD